ncbi:hypothetical protein VCRA2120E331_410021 [Vibrio crassostreae]|nr:hypothetical protein VCRA2120E331_410021 [Vibrio crassostreae]CAK3508418.1 hypothetical protein VCRA2127O345_410006 [Vibrio crassostreae]CAK3514987.1 hypothetical protein VCRA2120E330_400006 [Vibrio crassostreae]CAK3547192.1 hypothetical protein VCRA2122O338_410021 [Vibrio crassostreae]CAK3610889.1 hypothetical protein VCRA2122O340_410021 [Vibrio crassostreae]
MLKYSDTVGMSGLTVEFFGSTPSATISLVRCACFLASANETSGNVPRDKEPFLPFKVYRTNHFFRPFLPTRTLKPDNSEQEYSASVDRELGSLGGKLAILLVVNLKRFSIEQLLYIRYCLNNILFKFTILRVGKEKTNKEKGQLRNKSGISLLINNMTRLNLIKICL